MDVHREFVDNCHGDVMSRVSMNSFFDDVQSVQSVSLKALHLSEFLFIKVSV